jgi:hypothetical protein
MEKDVSFDSYLELKFLLGLPCSVVLTCWALCSSVMVSV